MRTHRSFAEFWPHIFGSMPVPGPGRFIMPVRPWSLVADFKMWWLWLTRRLEPELEAAGIRTTEPR